MGALIAWHYRSNMALRLADHTYVTCANGAKRWKCWGGSSGGAALRQGDGSTNRADAIAGHREDGGITCYGVNGVCHQSANRILFPAQITVRGAKGYYVSETMYGTYGRPRGILGMCAAPFNQYPQIAGDLAECEPDMRAFTDAELASVPNILDESKDSDEFQTYLHQVISIYNKLDTNTFEMEILQLTSFQLQLFQVLVEYKLSSSFVGSKLFTGLMHLRSQIEDARLRLENEFISNDIDYPQFVEQFNTLTMNFQKEIGDTLSAEAYRKLFDLEPDDVVILLAPRNYNETGNFER